MIRIFRGDGAQALEMSLAIDTLASNPSVSGGTFWEKQRPGVLLEIIGESVQHPVEVGHDVAPPLLEGMQHRHQHATGVGPSVRLRTEADLAGDDRGPQIAFGEVVVGGDPPILGPVIEAVDVGPEDLLDAPDAQVVRRLLHARHELRFERRRLPGELGVRDRLRAQPHRQGELWRHRTDKGRHLGRRGELFFEVLDLTQQVALAVRDGAGDLVIAAVAVDDQTAGQPGLAEDRLGHAGRTGLAEQEPAEPRGGEQPGIAIMPIRPPAGLVGMLDGGLAVCLDQPVRNTGKHAGHTVADLHHAPGAQARLFADAPQGEAVQILHRRRRRDALVAIKAVGQDSGGPWLEGPATAGAIPFGQPVEDAFGLHRVTVEDSPAVHPLVFQQCVTVGAAVAYDWRNVYHPFRLTGVEGVTSHPEVPRPCAFALGVCGWRGAGLDGPCGRQGRGAEKALGSLPFLVAQRLLQALECLSEPIDCPWLLQTLGTPVHGHRPSRQDTRGEPLGGGHTGMAAPRPNGAHARSARGQDSRGQEQAWSTPR